MLFAPFTTRISCSPNPASLMLGAIQAGSPFGVEPGNDFVASLNKRADIHFARGPGDRRRYTGHSAYRDGESKASLGPDDQDRIRAAYLSFEAALRYSCFRLGRRKRGPGLGLRTDAARFGENPREPDLPHCLSTGDVVTEKGCSLRARGAVHSIGRASNLRS